MLEERNGKRKKNAAEKIAKINEEIEPICYSYWDLNRGTSWLGLRGIGEPKPK